MFFVITWTTFDVVLSFFNWFQTLIVEIVSHKCVVKKHVKVIYHVFDFRLATLYFFFYFFLHCIISFYFMYFILIHMIYLTRFTNIYVSDILPKCRKTLFSQLIYHKTYHFYKSRLSIQTNSHHYNGPLPCHKILGLYRSGCMSRCSYIHKFPENTLINPKCLKQVNGNPMTTYLF